MRVPAVTNTLSLRVDRTNSYARSLSSCEEKIAKTARIDFVFMWPGPSGAAANYSRKKAQNKKDSEQNTCSDGWYDGFLSNLHREKTA